MKFEIALGAAAVCVLSAASPLAACTYAAAPEEIRRMFDEIKAKAPIVVEGYVQVHRDRKTGIATSQRLISQNFIKGARRDSYALVPAGTSCDISVPTYGRKSWRVYLQPTEGKFRVVGVEQIIETAE